MRGARTAPYLSVKPKSWAGTRATKTNESSSNEGDWARGEASIPCPKLTTPNQASWQPLPTLVRLLYREENGDKGDSEFVKGKREEGTVRAASTGTAAPSSDTEEGELYLSADHALFTVALHLQKPNPLQAHEKLNQRKKNNHFPKPREHDSPPPPEQPKAS